MLSCLKLPLVTSKTGRHSGSTFDANSSRALGLCLFVARRRLQPHKRTSGLVSAGTEAVPEPQTLSVAIGGREIILETGEIGRQANGAVLIKDGETVLYTTVCCEGDASEPSNFTPFSVHYSERFSAIGRTSGSFFRREGRPKANEMIISRLTDRPLRPMIPKGWNAETQVLSWLMSYDGQHQPEPLAITAAGAALAISDVPLSKCVAGVSIALIDKNYVVNPTAEQQLESSLDLIVAGTADAILMIEGFCDFLTEAQMNTALKIAAEAISQICSSVQSWANSVGKAKRTVPLTGDLTLDERLRSSEYASKVKDILRRRLGKHERGATVSEILEEAFKDDREGLKADGTSTDDGRRQFSQAFRRMEANVMRELIVEEGIRADGRSLTEVRPISSRCGLLPRTHGSVLFTRGETQSIAVTTLGSSEMAMHQDDVASNDEGPSRFYLQYSFPPSSVGETGRIAGPGRREVGHGILAERALQPIIPDEEEFPYTIRVESTITESNGSSSMASVCGGCLSLRDAGVPIKRTVAGVAMGLVITEDGQYRVLTDILGSEDASGDMDFKVAGDADGITAFQMDMKVEGISLEIMAEALLQARQARQHVLQEMAKCSPPPRNNLSPHAPHIVRVSVDPGQIGQVIGAGGKTIRGIRDSSGCSSLQLINEVDGQFEVVAENFEAAERVKHNILALVEEPEVGKMYPNSKIVGIEKFGMFVEFLPGKTGLLHFSELSSSEELTDFDLDDEIDIHLLAAEPSGKFKLSRKSHGEASSNGNNGGARSDRTQDRPSPGSVCRNAKVVDVKPYGVFVEVLQGFSGLVHHSELWAENESRETLNIGDLIPVMILEPRDGKQAFSRKQAIESGAEAAPAA